MRRSFSLGVLIASAVAQGCPTAADQPATASAALGSADNLDWTKLQEGIWWYGPGNNASRAVLGERNPFFDDRKPTVIYVHGWQTGSVAARRHETFNYRANDPAHGVDVDTADAWLGAGWNVGVYHWTQLADDKGAGTFENPWAAEAKIWTTNGPTGMRWKRPDGTFETTSVPRMDVAHLFVAAYASAMRGYRGDSVRFAGHSLGNQLVVRAASLLEEAADAKRLPANLVPSRVALLDPFWTSGEKSYLLDRHGAPMTPAARTTGLAYDLAMRGIVLEQYVTSIVGDFGDANAELLRTTAVADVRVDYTHAFVGVEHVTAEHVAAPNLYFWSYAFSPPPLCGTDDRRTLSAATTDSDLRRNMGFFRFPDKLGQAQGSYSATPSDNCFVREPLGRLREPLTTLTPEWSLISPQPTFAFSVRAPGARRVEWWINGERIAASEGGPDFSTWAELGDRLAPARLAVIAFDGEGMPIARGDSYFEARPAPGIFVRQEDGGMLEIGYERAPATWTRIELSLRAEEGIEPIRAAGRSTRYHPRRNGLHAFHVRALDDAGTPMGELDATFMVH